LSEKRLEKIIEDTKRKVESDKAIISESVIKKSLSYVSYETVNLAELLSRDGIHIIAEYKRKSPSLGKISDDKLADVVKEYETAGVSAISILTNNAFGGSISDIEEARQLTKLPILRKEFIIDQYQLFQSRIYGADFVLLIARILSGSQLSDFLGLIEYLGMSALVEVESSDDLEKALKAEADIIGVNNRDLKSFAIDREKGLELAKMIPPEKQVVIESGIAIRADLDPFLDAGFHNFLIGSSLMKSSNRIDAIDNLLLKSTCCY